MVISNLKIGTSYFFTPLAEFAKENIRYRSLILGCSNSESVDYAGWENSYNDDSEEDAPIEPQKQGCFNNFRLPDLQSIACQKKFYSYSGQHKLPEWN